MSAGSYYSCRTVLQMKAVPTPHTLNADMCCTVKCLMGPTCFFTLDSNILMDLMPGLQT